MSSLFPVGAKNSLEQGARYLKRDILNQYKILI